MATISITRLSDRVGADVTGLDVEQLLTDDSLAGTLLDALEEHGADNVFAVVATGVTDRAA